MAYRESTGRKITVQKNPKDVRAILRRHLREEKKTIAGDLARAWNMHPTSAHRRFYSDRSKRGGAPFTPQMIDAAVEMLGLDEFDAHELRLQGAIESGWQINPAFTWAPSA